MGKKLYEANTIRSVANALRNKVKEYYTFTKDGSVDTTGVTDNFDGLNQVTSKTNKKGTKVNDGKAKYPSMTTPSGNGFWYEYDYMLKEIAPMPDDGRWPVPGDDFDKEAPRYNKTVSGFLDNDLGIRYLTTRLGFPEATTSRRLDIKSLFGSSGAKYIVPDNGWVFATTNSALAGRRLQLTNLTNNMIVKGQTNQHVNKKLWNSRGTNHIAVNDPANRHTDRIYVSLLCARYDEIQLDYKNISMVISDNYMNNISEAESNGAISELSIYFIPARKTNYASDYVDPKGDTSIPENNQLTLGKNKPFVVSLSGSSYTAASDGWFYATNTELGAGHIVINCTSNGMIASSSETSVVIDKGSKRQQASDPSSGPGKEAVITVKAYPYCFMPLAKGATVSVSGGNKYYFLNAV